MFVRLPGQTRDKNVEVSVAVPTVEVRREENRDAENGHFAHTNIKYDRKLLESRYKHCFVLTVSGFWWV